MSLIIKEEAKLDIEDAYNWYASKNEKLGESLTRYIDLAFNSIINSPEGFKIINKNKRAIPLKKFPYLVIYEVFDNEIVILAVFHTSPHPKKRKIN